MNNKFSLLLILPFLLSCDGEGINSPIVSNEFTSSLDYSIDLDWDNSQSRSITEVHIKWSQWITNDTTDFVSYYIKDVTTENDKLLDDIVNAGDTTYSVDFPTGTFLKICVLANFSSLNDSNLDFVSSDTIQFFTQPMSPVSDIIINTQPFEHTISWSPSQEENITGLVLYKSYIEENDNIPNLLINPSNGLPEDSEWQWNIIHETNNLDSSYVDAETILSDYNYFYSIKVQIEDSENIENYRYSLIIPAVDGMINSITPHLFNLTASTELENYILLEWEQYQENDFYAYEVWRSDVLATSIEELESSGEKLAEITDKDLDYFEDRLSIGTGKKWYYFIRVYNSYGDEIESEIVQGDTRL